jgi:hypothetical protein
MASTISRFELLPYQREKIQIIIDHILKRKHLHIYGSEGTGKSALLDWIYYNWKEIDNLLIPIYCKNSRTLREILLRISGFLLDRFKHLESIDKFKRVKEIRYPEEIEKLNIRCFSNLVYTYLPQGNFCIILDHLEYVTPRIHALLRVLYEKALVITAGRQSWELSDYNFRGKLDYCLYLVPKLRIDNLKKNEAFVLMEYLYDSLKIDVSGKTQMLNDIFHITNGNPKMINEIFKKAQNPEYFRDGVFNLKLILLDCKIDKVNNSNF